MSDLKLNKTEPARTQSYADSSSTSSESISRPDPAQTKVPSQLVRQYLQQLSQQQGQLPDLMAQKQQALLRQLAQLLESQTAPQASQEAAGSVSTTTSVAATANSHQPLQQLLQRLLPLLSANDPLLKQPLAQRGSEVILLRQLAQSPQLLSTLLQQLPPALQESSASGRALMQWLVQSITLRLAPQKMPQSLVTQLQQQQVSLAIIQPDKRSLQNLEHLNRATLQFIQHSQAAVNQSGELISLGGRPTLAPSEAKTETSQDVKPQTAPVRPEMATIKTISPEKLAQSLLSAANASEGTETHQDAKPQAAHARPEVAATKAISAEKLAQQLSVPESATEEPASEAETAPSTRVALQTKGATSSTQLPNGEQKHTATIPVTSEPNLKNRVEATTSAVTANETETEVAQEVGQKVKTAVQPLNATVVVANEPANKLATGLSPRADATLAIDKHATPLANAAADATEEQPLSPPRPGSEQAQSKATATKTERQPILQRMAALLHAGPSTAEQDPVATLDPAAKPLIIPNRMSLGSFIHEIHLHLAGRQLPDPLKPALKNLVDAMAQPLTQPDAVEQWFDFLRQPLSSDSTAGRALQQWALTLLSIRLQQMAAATDPAAPTQQQLQSLLNNEEHQQLTHKLAASLFGQTERFQQLQQDAQQQIPNYVPLPPQQPGDREGGLSLQRSAGKQSPYQWTLSFFIELPQLGPLQIRACLDIPDIQLQVMAERLSAVDKIKETLPLLEGRFRELGLTPGGFVCRQGKIIPPKTEDELSSASPSAGVSIRI